MSCLAHIVDKMADNVEDLENLFSHATKHVRLIADQLAAEKLLYFYARFKQATEGKCKTAKPSFFDFQGKVKWEAWSKLGCMKKDQAMLEYIMMLSTVDVDWTRKLGTSSGLEKVEETSCKKPGPHGFGVSVSVMANTDRELSDSEKTVFDFCQEGNIDRVRWLLVKNRTDINCLDQEGLGLLHWACDRGDLEMAKMLLNMGADVNKQDRDSQTALHYAISCEHKDVTELLLKQGINVTLKDNEGNTAMDVASEDMKVLLQTRPEITT